MATFREIDERLTALVDDEGEILDVEAFEALQMERTAKAENMGKWVLDLVDDQEAIKKEISRLKTLLAHAERKEKGLKEHLCVILGGEKLKTATISITYRNTDAVEIMDEAAVRGFAELNGYDDILRYKAPEISKTEIKRLISEGVEIPGAVLATHTSIIIK